MRPAVETELLRANALRMQTPFQRACVLRTTSQVNYHPMKAQRHFTFPLWETAATDEIWILGLLSALCKVFVLARASRVVWKCSRVRLEGYMPPNPAARDVAGPWPEETAVGRDPTILTLKEVAQILRCSKAHVANVINGNVKGLPRLAHLAVGRRKLVRREWLNQWMESNKVRC